MDWSFQLYSARNFQPWDAVFDMLAGLGYAEVEGYGGVYDDAAAIRAALDRNGLAMPTGHFSLDMLEHSYDAARRLADVLGIATLICPHVEEHERPADAAGWRGLGERLAAIGEKARRDGHGLAWHNHDFELRPLADGSLPLDHMLAAAPDMGWEMDLAWLVRAGADPAGFIARYARRIMAAHVKDIARPGEATGEDGWSDVGHGTIDWRAMLKLLRSKTGARRFVMEHDNPSDVERFARRSIEAVRSF